MCIYTYMFIRIYTWADIMQTNKLQQPWDQTSLLADLAAHIHSVHARTHQRRLLNANNVALLRVASLSGWISLVHMMRGPMGMVRGVWGYLYVGSRSIHMT